jgi:hypothetical protein
MKNTKVSFVARRNLFSLLALFLITVAAPACSKQENGKTITTMEARIAEMQSTVEALKARSTAAAVGSSSDRRYATPAPIKSSGRVSAVPLAIEKSEPSGGWQHYRVTLAIVNNSNRIVRLPINLGEVTFETQEGYRYEGGQYLFGGRFGTDEPIPPGFSVRGPSYSRQDPFPPSGFSFSVAATTYPIRAVTKQMGSIDLTHIVALQFPTDHPSQEFVDFPSTLQIKHKGTLTFGDVSVGDEYPGNSSSRNISVLIGTQFKNSNPGYQTEIQGQCYMYDGDGWIYRARLEDKSGWGQRGFQSWSRARDSRTNRRNSGGSRTLL